MEIDREESDLEGESKRDREGREETDMEGERRRVWRERGDVCGGGGEKKIAH